MRIVCVAQADIAAVATMLVGKLTELLGELCKVRTPLARHRAFYPTGHTCALFAC